MYEQSALFVPTVHGEQPADSIQARLRSRAADPMSSVLAASSVDLTEQQEFAQTILATMGPGTTREIARRWAKHGPMSEGDIHHLLARRLPELEGLGLVTCRRVKDATAKTVQANYRRCEVCGRTMLVWEMVPCSSA